MVILSNPYEEYMLDYLEGNLPSEMKKQMDSYFQNHPDQWEEYKDVHRFMLPIEPIFYSHKKELKKKKAYNLYIPMSIAASIALFIIAAKLFSPYQKPEVVIQSPNVSSQTPVALESPSVEADHLSSFLENENQAQTSISPKQDIIESTPSPKSNVNDFNSSEVAITNLQNHKKTDTNNAPLDISNNDANVSIQKDKTSNTFNEDISTNQALAITNKENIIDKNTPTKQTNEIDKNQLNKPIYTADTSSKEDNVEAIIEYPINQSYTASVASSNQGFEVETFPSTEEMQQNVINKQSSASKESRSGFVATSEQVITGLLGVNEEKEQKFKKSLLPHAFGLGEKKEQNNITNLFNQKKKITNENIM